MGANNKANNNRQRLNESEPSQSSHLDDRQGPPHSNSNGAAVGGPANQVPGVGQGAGGPGDGQGPGNGAGQGRPQSERTPENPEVDNHSDQSQGSANQPPHDSENHDEGGAPFIHPEPPTTSTAQTSAQNTESQADATQTPDPDTDPERNGAAHNNSNGAAVDGPANQVQDVGQDAGGTGDGQGSGNGAGEGISPSDDRPQTPFPTVDGSEQPTADEPATSTKPIAEIFTDPIPTSNNPQTPTPTPTLSTAEDPAQEQAPSSQDTSATTATSTSTRTTTPFQALQSTQEPKTNNNAFIHDDGLLDLTDIHGEDKTLKVVMTSDCDFTNRVAFIKVDHDPLTGISIDGQRAENSDAFRQLVRDQLINPNNTTLEIGGQTEQSFDWTISSDQAGFYAPVLITELGELMTLGSAADDRKHVLIKDGNMMCFEDLLSHQGSDWDYNDLTVRITES